MIIREGKTMCMPHFFKQVPSISLKDPLSDVLGASASGVLSYTYEDVVKLAGHSCPTAAGVYLMLLKGLEKLYGDSLPQRGNIRVTVKGVLGEGTVGVVANIVTMVTGATEQSGFHGIGGKFDRRNLLTFDETLPYDLVLERLDTHRRVGLNYNPAIVPSDPKMGEWMQSVIAGSADDDVKGWFKNGWQERVRRILIDYRDEPVLVKASLIDPDRL